ncbi:unnamed protein product [Penicillium manginii]
MEAITAQEISEFDTKNALVRETKAENGSVHSLSKQELLVLLGLASLSLMAALDGTSVAVALPIIAQDLNGSTIEAFWTGTSFTLCSAVATLWFLIGAIVAGVAKNFTHMLIGRSLQGIGGGGIITLTAIVIADIVPLCYRAKYFGMLGGIWSLGIGAALVAWSSSFETSKSSFSEQIRKIDFLGMLLFIPSTASFLIPLSWGGILYRWDSWHTIAPLVTGAVGLCLFAVYEYQFAKQPMVPPAIFHNRTSLISFGGYMVVGLLIWCFLYFLPLYYEAVKGFEPIMSGVALFPETFTLAPSAIVIGFIISKTGQYYWAICIGWGLSTLGAGLMYLLSADTSTAEWVCINLVPGIGIGMVLPSVALAVQASATAENLAIAVAMSTFFRGFGQSIGVAIGGVIFQNRMKSNLLTYPALRAVADKYSGEAASAVQLIRLMENGPMKNDLREAYANSLKVVWAFCCVISGVIFVISFWTKSYSLGLVFEEQDLKEEEA